jgi:signal transduction histidine kinase
MKSKTKAQLIEELIELTVQLEQEITERQRAEEALKVANEEFSQYASIVSHDLQAPLRAIHHYTDFLQEDLALSLTGDQQLYLQGLARAVRETEDLVGGLLQLSRVGRHSSSAETIDLGLFLQALVASLNLSAEVEIDLANSWPSLETDPILLQQIFQNLILNGVKFNCSVPRRLELRWQPLEPERYELSVRDNGIGIAPHFQEQIFQVFRRLHTQQEYEGTGIGLAIVKKAVDKLYGSIRVESKLGQGSTFFVTLPVKSPTGG